MLFCLINSLKLKDTQFTLILQKEKQKIVKFWEAGNSVCWAFFLVSRKNVPSVPEESTYNTLLLSGRQLCLTQPFFWSLCRNLSVHCETMWLLSLRLFYFKNHFPIYCHFKTIQPPSLFVSSSVQKHVTTDGRQPSKVSTNHDGQGHCWWTRSKDTLSALLWNTQQWVI